jgi:hypothetical protein
MARIKDESVEAVKAPADIVTLVEGYTRLRKSGARFVGLCPFHQEKTPSFGVSPDRGSFKCFGCGEGGDAIAFVEKLENLDFVGAIEFLADRFNVPIEYEETSPEQDRQRRQRERLFALLEQATAFYERHLWESPRGEAARAYLESRGLGEDVCREYRLGLAPGEVRTGCLAPRGLPTMALVEARRLLEQREQPLAPPTSRVLLRRGLLELEGNAVALREPLDRLGEVELLRLTDEADDVAALAAAEAVEELVGRVDREARRLLVVEGAEPGPARARTPELRPRRDDLDHVGGLDRFANRCLPNPGHYNDSTKLRAKRSVIPAM